MALHIQTLKTRALTAVVFVVIMLGGLLINRWGLLSLFIIVHFGCWYEYLKLIRKIYGVKAGTRYTLGLLYITLPILMLADLATSFTSFVHLPANAPFYLFPCAVIFSIWINDTMAYLVGSLIGSTPFSSISPKKTWEGTAGGALLCVVVITLLGRALPVAQLIPLRHWTVIAALCAVFGTAGDLLESKLKRMAGVKDSGSIMPGHGGFLDRFDSLLVATPAIWLYLYFFL